MQAIGKIAAILSGGIAALTVAAAWVVQKRFPYFTGVPDDFNLWVGRALWCAIALGAIGVLLSWAGTSRVQKIMRAVLIFAVALIGVLNLDFTPGVKTYGQSSYSKDWTSRNISEWQEVLAPLVGKPDIHGLEIGTFEGRSAIWFLENILTHSSSSITCVDIFSGSYEAVFDSNMKRFGDRAKKIRGMSQSALRQLTPSKYDFAYVDGSHDAKDVLMDAMLTWDLLKPGGIMIFDDYAWQMNEKLSGDAFKPRIAVDAFLHVMEPYVDVLYKGYQVAVRKRSEINRRSRQVVGE